MKKSARSYATLIQRLGTPLDYSQEGARPFNLRKQAYQAASLGALHAENGTFRSQDTSLKNARIALRADVFGNGDSAWTRLIRSIFWLSASKACAKMKMTASWMGRYVIQYGARSQQELTRALARMRPEDREFVSQLFEKDPLLRLDWHWGCRGAFSVVQVAWLLGAQGHPVVMPSVDVDIEDKIDLFVELPTEPRRYLGLQIKSGTLPYSTASVLNEDTLALLCDGRRQRDEFRLNRKTLEKIRAFSSRRRIDCIPTIVTVGKSPSRPWDLDPHNYLSEALLVLVGNAA